MAMGLRVVRDDGGPIGFRQALVRGLAVLVDLPTGFTVSVLCMLLHPRSKRLGDLLAGTLVVQERVATAGGAVAVMPPPLEAWARTLDLSRLPRRPGAVGPLVRLARARDLRSEAREDLGGRLVAAVQAVTAPPPPPGTPGWAYLVGGARRAPPPGGRAVRRPGPAGTGPVGPAPSAPAAEPGDEPPRPGSFALPS